MCRSPWTLLAFALAISLVLGVQNVRAQPGAAIELRAGPITVDQVEAVMSPAATPPDQGAGWRALALPDLWSRSRPGFSGTVWYRFHVWIDEPSAMPWSVLVTKVVMNADLWVNGELAGRVGRMDDGQLSRHWNTPLLFNTTAVSWHAGENLVHLRVKAEAGHGGGLAPPVIGPTNSLSPLYEQAVWWRKTLVSVCNVFVMSLGLFVLFVWMRHREQAQYGYFGAAAIVWGLANTNMTSAQVPLPDGLWEVAIHSLTLWALLLLCLFGIRFAARPRPRLELAFVGYALLGTAAHAAAGARWQIWTHAALALPVLLIGVYSLAMMIRHIRHHRIQDHLIVGSACLATLGIGLHDWMLKIEWLPFDRPFGLPYVAPVLLSALGWLIAGEYARSRADLADLNRDLAQQVEQREAALRTSFEQIAQIQREHVAAAERARILRDMHDGVGAHLTTAMRQLESGKADPGAIAQVLRDSLDQLKLSIDAVHLPEGDVNALLASLRYRLQPRIEAAGLMLGWSVKLLPEWPGGHVEGAMRHLQFLLFEAISNALQHSGATALHLAALDDGGEIVVTLSDNGRGFDAGRGRAPRTMRERAQALHANLKIESSANGTTVRVQLPVEQ